MIREDNFLSWNEVGVCWGVVFFLFHAEQLVDCFGLFFFWFWFVIVSLSFVSLYLSIFCPLYSLFYYSFFFLFVSREEKRTKKILRLSSIHLKEKIEENNSPVVIY